MSKRIEFIQRSEPFYFDDVFNLGVIFLCGFSMDYGCGSALVLYI